MNKIKKRPSLYAKSSLISIKSFFTYSTVRTASIESKTVGLTYRLSQLAILTYVIGFLTFFFFFFNIKIFTWT